MKKAIKAIIPVIALIFLLCGCTVNSGENLIFGTFYSITLKGTSCNSTIKDIDALLTDMESRLSTAVEGSDIERINNASANVSVAVDTYTIELFKKSMELYNMTEKAFNPALFPLVELWKFSPDTFSYSVDSIPTDNDIQNTLSYCKMENFILDEENCSITKTVSEAKLDFGGIAKGYAVDLALNLANEKKEALIDIGGNIATFGAVKKIGITHPRAANEIFGTVNIENSAIATSGDYERYYIYNNVRYHHIIARNGYPSGSENGIISVSIIGESAMLCDAYSTTVMILGFEWAEENLPKAGYSCIIITEGAYKVIGDVDFEAKQNNYERK